MLTAVGDGARNLLRLQPSPSKWSWGELHAIRFRHPLDRVAPEAAGLLDLGPVPRPGDSNTVNATSGSAGGGYAQSAGASYREIFDLANWDRSLAVNTPGQSAQPGSTHYSDLLPLWDKGEYFPLAYSRAAVEREATQRLVLEPKR